MLCYVICNKIKIGLSDYKIERGLTELDSVNWKSKKDQQN